MNNLDCVLPLTGGGDSALPIALAFGLLVVGAVFVALRRRGRARAALMTTAGAIVLVGALIFAPALTPTPAVASDCGPSSSQELPLTEAPETTTPETTVPEITDPETETERPGVCVDSLPWDAGTAVGIRSDLTTVDFTDVVWAQTMMDARDSAGIFASATSATIRIEGRPHGVGAFETLIEAPAAGTFTLGAAVIDMVDGQAVLDTPGLTVDSDEFEALRAVYGMLVDDFGAANVRVFIDVSWDGYLHIAVDTECEGLVGRMYDATIVGSGALEDLFAPKPGGEVDPGPEPEMCTALPWDEDAGVWVELTDGPEARLQFRDPEWARQMLDGGAVMFLDGEMPEQWGPRPERWINIEARLGMDQPWHTIFDDHIEGDFRFHTMITDVDQDGTARFERRFEGRAYDIVREFRDDFAQQYGWDNVRVSVYGEWKGNLFVQVDNECGFTGRGYPAEIAPSAGHNLDGWYDHQWGMAPSHLPWWRSVDIAADLVAGSVQFGDPWWGQQMIQARTDAQLHAWATSISADIAVRSSSAEPWSTQSSGPVSGRFALSADVLDFQNGQAILAPASYSGGAYDSLSSSLASYVAQYGAENVRITVDVTWEAGFEIAALNDWQQSLVVRTFDATLAPWQGTDLNGMLVVDALALDAVDALDADEQPLVLDADETVGRPADTELDPEAAEDEVAPEVGDATPAAEESAAELIAA